MRNLTESMLHQDFIQEIWEILYDKTFVLTEDKRKQVLEILNRRT